MPEHSPDIRLPPEAQAKGLEPGLDGLHRPERVLPGSDVQAQIAAAVVGRIDGPVGLGISVQPRPVMPQDAQSPMVAARSVAEVHVSIPEATPKPDEGAGVSVTTVAQSDLIKRLASDNNPESARISHEGAPLINLEVDRGAKPNSGLEQRREVESPAQTTQRETLAERSRQELSQNVEQVRLDIVRGTQGRAAAEALGAVSAVGEMLSHNPSSSVAVAPSEIGKIGTSLPEVREQVLDRIARVQEQLYVLSAAGAARPEAHSSIQGRGDFRGNAELRHDAKPESVVARTDRSDPSQLSRVSSSANQARSSEPAWLRTQPSNTTVREIDRPIPPPAAERAKHSLDIVSRLVRSCSDIQLAKRIQEGVDTLCYTLFGVVAIGALAGDRATRFTYRTLRQLVGEMRKRAADENIEEEARQVLHDATQELTESLVEFSREVDRVAASTVADVCGSIVHAGTGEPLAGILVNGGVLGQAVTNERGVFIFKNIPFHTPYELTPMHARYEFIPGRIVGLCVELNFERFQARLRAI
jgi:hypothetical protein